MGFSRETRVTLIFTGPVVLASLSIGKSKANPGGYSDDAGRDGKFRYNVSLLPPLSARLGGSVVYLIKPAMRIVPVMRFWASNTPCCATYCVPSLGGTLRMSLS